MTHALVLKFHSRTPLVLCEIPFRTRCLVPERKGVGHENVPKPEDLWDNYYTGGILGQNEALG